MKKYCFIALLTFFTGTASLFSQKWLPESMSARPGFRLLECRYNQAQLAGTCPAGKDWKAEVQKTAVPGGIRYTFRFVAQRDLQQAGVAVAFDQPQWSSDNYVMVPSAVYNGNRQRIVNREYATGLDKTDYFRPDLALTSNPIPQLSPEFGQESRFELLVNNAATPAITFFERNRHSGTLLLTDQGIEHGGHLFDHGLIAEESRGRDQATFVISAPGVREKQPQFIGFSKSPDRGLNVRRGDELCISVTRIDFFCDSVTTLLEQFMKYRKSHLQGAPPRQLMPMSAVLERMTRNIDERYHKGKDFQFYCPENAQWMSYGWVGGLINTYPMLALGDSLHRERVASTFNFALPRAKGKSGYYYNTLNEDGQVLNRDAVRQVNGIALTRQNADVLYWTVKQFALLKAQGHGNVIRPEWEQEVQRLADAFVRTWRKHGTWGNYLQVETGDVAVYNATGGAMAVAGLTLAAEYYDRPEYLQVAKAAAARYYREFALTGFTSGGCGDILQNADSETAIALTTSLFTLYETTHEAAYLQQAKDLAHLCATWTVSFPYRLPAETPLGRLQANLTGAVWASTQNKHGAPGFCTQSGDVLFKLYRATGDTLYAELLRDVIHAHAEGIQPNGKITERLTYCDADSRGSRLDGGKTGWNETNGALMAIEIPGIYIRTDLKKFYVFDHVEASLTEKKGHLWLEIYNPTAFDATVTLLAENAEEAGRTAGENAFLHWKRKIQVKSGKTEKIKLS